MRMKKLAVMALATALSVGSVMTASAAWLQEGMNWRYQNDNGTFQTGTWFRDGDGRWYHFDNNGIMQKGWFQDADGKWYFLAYNGVMQVGLIKVDNNVYYMGTSGDLFIGEMKIGNTTYNFGLYGTTNGQPSVPASATYGGNGNQSLNGGGGGSSSSGGSTSRPTPAPVPDEVGTAVEKVQDTVNNVEEEAAEVLSKIDVPAPKMAGENKATVPVTVTVKKEIKTQEDVETVRGAVIDLANAAVENADEGAMITVVIPEGVVIPGLPSSIKSKEIKADDFDSEMTRLLENYLVVENIDSYKTGQVASIIVPVKGVDVTYTITLK